MSRDYDSIELEHAIAVAAAAFAISSQVDDKKSPISQLSKRFSGSFRITDDQGYHKVPTSPVREEKKPGKTITPTSSMKKTPTFSDKSKSTDGKKHEIPAAPKRTPTFGDKHLMNTDAETPKPKVPPLVDQTMSLRPPPPPSPPQSPPPRQSTPARLPSGTQGQIPTRSGSRSETKADAWEREELKKIKERYEKLLETIDTWEKRKKMKARRKLNKYEQSESERKRAKALRKYQDKIKYIEEIATGAKAQADERRRNETLKAKEKANTIRTTGKLPGLCSCF